MPEMVTATLGVFCSTPLCPSNDLEDIKTILFGSTDSDKVPVQFLSVSGGSEAWSNTETILTTPLLHHLPFTWKIKLSAWSFYLYQVKALQTASYKLYS